MGLRVVLWYAPKEIQCPTHGRVQEEIPWAPPYARVTYRLEWRLCALCQIMTQQAAAEMTHHCPQVTLVIDRFHLVKALNHAVDEVRKEPGRSTRRAGRRSRGSGGFWDYRYRASATKFLTRWMTAARRSRVPSLRTFVGTLRTRRLPHILAFIDRPLTNDVAEGLNRIVTIVENRASGYRHVDHFADLIYLTVGDLDIPGQIPSHLRTF